LSDKNTQPPTGGEALSVQPGAILSASEWTNLRLWYGEHGRHHLPWRKASTPWNVLLAEVLLHRTRASAVEALYDEVSTEFPSPETVIRRPADWIKITSPAGLSWRAELFVSTCEQLVFLHGSEVPAEWAALTSLPGVGHYIASTVRCFGFGIPEVIVDTNTIRLASRIAREALNPTHHRSQKVRRTVSQLLEDGTAGYAEDNYTLLDLAAIVCRTGQLECARCPVVSGCKTGREFLTGFARTGDTNGR
jgi:A/G-specific adenine glycosylase